MIGPLCSDRNSRAKTRAGKASVTGRISLQFLASVERTFASHKPSFQRSAAKYLQHVTLEYSYRQKGLLILSTLRITQFFGHPPRPSLIYNIPIHLQPYHHRPRRQRLPQQRLHTRPLTAPSSCRSKPANTRLPLPRRIHPLRPPRLPVRPPLARMER